MYTCKVCGEEATSDQYHEKMKEMLKFKKICFDCNFWESVLEEINHPEDRDTSIVDIWVTDDYEVYYAKKSKSGGFQGFGGREFIAQKTDGSVVTSNNVWHRGTVDQAWKEHITPNIIRFI